MHQKIAYRKAIGFNPWGFTLHVNNHHNDGEKQKHKAQGAQVFFYDVFINRGQHLL